MIQPLNETEDLLPSITKNGETLIEQTHKKEEETLEIKMTKSSEIYHFKPPIPIQVSWMIRLLSLEVYNSFFNNTQENNKFEFYTGYVHDEISYNQLKDKVAKVLGLPNITSEELEHETFGPKIFEKSQTAGYYLLLRNYVHSPFRDFESYLRTLTGLNGDDFQVILKQYKSKFITYQIPQALIHLRICL